MNAPALQPEAPAAGEGFAVGARPRPAAAGAGWCLRFAGGDMKGRVVALHRGRSSAGSSAACQIVLPGHEVRPHHADFEVGSLAVTVRAEPGAVLHLNGEDIGPQRRALVVGDTLLLGRTELQLDRSYPAPEHEAGAAEWQAGAASAALAPPVRAAGAGGRRVAAAVLLLAAAGLALAGWSSWSGGSPAPRRPAAGLEPLLAAYPEVELRLGPGGQWALKGIVETRERKEALLRAAAADGRAVTVSVQAADELVEQARRYLGDAAVSVAYAGGGRLVVTGSVDSEAVRQRVRALGEDLHPTVTVTDKLQVREKTEAEREQAREADQRARWSAWQSLLPARMVGVSEDPSGRRYIQLANGSRLYEGALLRSGAELQRIEADRLVISGAETPVPKGP